MEEMPRHGFVLSSKGGMVTDWQVEGKPILFPHQKIVIRGIEKDRGGMFFCFPNYGPVAPKFHLPQHGVLRKLEGTRRHDLWDSETVYFNTTQLFPHGRQCEVSVSAASGTTLQEMRTLYYELRVTLPRSPGNINPVVVSPGVHPYFATPEGVAKVQVGMTTYTINRLITEAEYLPFSGGHAVITIPGIGVIDMALSSTVLSRTARLVLWRDSWSYLCVEPVYDKPENYGTSSSYFLRERGFFSARLKLSLR